MNDIILDIETTGLSRTNDEILQISIIDTNSNILFNQYIKPSLVSSWPHAENVHHISPNQVASCPPLDFFRDELNDIFKNASHIITYNGESFDIPFLISKGFPILESIPSIDVMKIYASTNHCKWQKLSSLSSNLGFISDSYHNSLTDVFATLHIYNFLHKS